jgi:hypothetical protein
MQAGGAGGAAPRSTSLYRAGPFARRQLAGSANPRLSWVAATPLDAHTHRGRHPRKIGVAAGK